MQNITISNTGATPIALQTPSVSGVDFKITANTCGASLGPSVGLHGCDRVSLRRLPGRAAGPSAITDDAGTQTASLSGVGTSPATDALAPLALTFAPQQLNTASAAQQITLTNAGDLPLTLIAAQITSGDFTVVNACGNSLNAHSTCSINVAFVPKNVGTISGRADGLGSISHADGGAERHRRRSAGVSLVAGLDGHFPATGVGIRPRRRR